MDAYLRTATASESATDTVWVVETVISYGDNYGPFK